MSVAGDPHSCPQGVTLGTFFGQKSGKSPLPIKAPDHFLFQKYFSEGQNHRGTNGIKMVFSRHLLAEFFSGIFSYLPKIMHYTKRKV